MNQQIFDNWNDVVKQNDIVYHLGDVYFGKWNDQINLLPGKKRLILGNHDNPLDPNFQGVFSKIMMWRIFREFDLCLTHVPIHMEEGDDAHGRKYSINAHGHIHQHKSPTAMHRNLSVENTDFKLVNIEDAKNLP